MSNSQKSGEMEKTNPLFELLSSNESANESDNKVVPHKVLEDSIEEEPPRCDDLATLEIPSFVAYNSQYGFSDFVMKLCVQKKHRWLCAIPIEFIANSANSRGFRNFPMYQEALAVLKGDVDTTKVNIQDPIAKSAVALYYLIHARFAVTDQGLAYILKKYHNHEFGSCPRYFCYNQPVLPFGFSPDLGRNFTQIFCGKCTEMYTPCNPINRIDGAAYGPSLPEAFFMHFPHLRPHLSTKKYQPKLYGFQIHPSCYQKESFSDDEDSDDFERFQILQFSERVE